MRFCGRCGAPLAARCPHCGAEVPPDFRFCGHCGKSLQDAPTPAAPERAVYTPKHLADKILKSRSALEGERRQVTVLFADLAGFTSLAEKLDPEEVHRIVNGCFERITAEVHRFEGTINQYTGDGVMALFGAPIAHEDSARRAVHAALGIQRAIADYAETLRAERGPALAMRIGLNTGAVVVGAIGDDLRMDYTAVGDTTNLAARMQQTARPGTVVVSEATHRAIEGFFETIDLGRVDVKGHEPVRAWQVVRTRGARSRIAVGRERGLTPFVGRDRELQTLLARFGDVEAGRGQVVFIAGDAGIGKSRLLYELRRRLAEEPRRSMHLAFGLTTALMMLGRDGEALAVATRGLADAEQTHSLKYVGWFHARRGELALRVGDGAAALESLERAVAIACRIAYPTLTWQAADLLARAQILVGDAEKAGAAARLAHDTVARIAAAAPEASLAATLWRWPRVIGDAGDGRTRAPDVARAVNSGTRQR